MLLCGHRDFLVFMVKKFNQSICHVYVIFMIVLLNEVMIISKGYIKYFISFGLNADGFLSFIAIITFSLYLASFIQSRNIQYVY